MEVGVGQGPADPHRGIDPLDGLDGGPVGGDLDLEGLLRGRQLEAGDPVRRRPQRAGGADPGGVVQPGSGGRLAQAHLAQEDGEVGLVHGADEVEHVAELGGDAAAVAGEEPGRGLILPAAAGDEPGRGGEVVVGDDRGEPVLVAGAQHVAVVGDGDGGELPGGRLDAAPLQGEAVGVEPQGGQQRDVGAVAVVVVAGVAGGLGVHGVRDVLVEPHVVVGVAALDLVGGGGGPPQEVLGEGSGGGSGGDGHGCLLGSARSYGIGGPGGPWRVGTRRATTLLNGGGTGPAPGDPAESRRRATSRP